MYRNTEEGRGRQAARPLMALGGIAAAAVILTLGLSAVAAQPKGISVAGLHRRTLSTGALRTAEKSATRGVPSRDHKTLAFHGKSVNLVVTTGPENDMLSYRVEGMRNPALMVDRGAALHVLFVNTDDDMEHDFRVTAQRAPFPMQPDRRQSAGSSDLPHQAKASRYAEEMTLRLAPGSYTYICAVKGHAKGGMYGQLIVK